MKTLDVGLQTAATALLALGLSAIGANFWQGAIEIALGIVCYVVYEFTPAA